MPLHNSPIPPIQNLFEIEDHLPSPPTCDDGADIAKNSDDDDHDETYVDDEGEYALMVQSRRPRDGASAELLRAMNQHAETNTKILETLAKTLSVQEPSSRPRTLRMPKAASLGTWAEL